MGESTVYSERKISYEELKTHDSYDDAWISINGIVYDITNFVDAHPFGDTFRGTLGTECSGLFSATHVNTDVEAWLKKPAFLANNNIRVVGRLDMSESRCGADDDKALLNRIVYQDADSDPFWRELKDRVGSYLRENNETTHFTFGEGVAYLSYYLVIYVVLSYLAWIQGSLVVALVAAALLGIHMICALSNIAHMATHFGFTRSQPLNETAYYLFDLAGMSGLEWQITHQTHHHQPHSPIDHQTNVYDYIGARVHQFKPRRAFHKYQRLYFWITVSPYLLFKFLAIPVWMVINRQFLRYKSEIAIHLCARAVLIGWIAACGYMHGFWTAFLVTVVYSIAYSQTAFILLFNDHEETHHLLSETEDVNRFHGKISWAEVQVRTSNDWYPTNWISAFFEFHYGYFNYHIEHHLFPSLKPPLLKKISPIVREVCEKHRLPYISTPFMVVQRSLLRHITRMGTVP